MELLTENGVGLNHVLQPGNKANTEQVAELPGTGKQVQIRKSYCQNVLVSL